MSQQDETKPNDNTTTMPPAATTTSGRTAASSGRGRSVGGRSASSGRGLYHPQQQRPQQQQQPPAMAPSGVPYGHVPAYLPGSASLVEQLDQRLMIVLRDGRHLVGTLRSFDQFSNMVMEDVSERRTFVGEEESVFCDVPLGLYVVRGDSIVLLGQISSTEKMKRVELEEFLKLQQATAPDKQQELVWDFDTDLTA